MRSCSVAIAHCCAHCKSTKSAARIPRHFSALGPAASLHVFQRHSLLFLMLIFNAKGASLAELCKMILEQDLLDFHLVSRIAHLREIIQRKETGQHDSFWPAMC
jgi:hypothetical protein